MTELIIHPRTQKDFYKGTPRMETFATAVDSFKVHGIRTPLCYNGDIVDLESFTNMTTQFPTIDRTMIGRGLLAKPGLVFLLKDGAYPADYRERLRAFHDEIYDGYCRDFSGEKDALFHMKEIWGYMADSFVDSEKPLKQIRKSQTVAEYKPIANYILSNLEIQ